jgi:CelD/BcsL family acetyltransferase involved in cellulose biosynthesis
MQDLSREKEAPVAWGYSTDADSPGEKHITAEVFGSFEELAEIRQKWDELAQLSGAEVFLTFDWCRLWWKYYGAGRTLRVFVFTAADGLVGVVPLFSEAIRLWPVWVKAVKVVGSDFTMPQFGLPIKREYILPVVRRLYGKLRDEQWDILHIGPLSGLYKSYELLRTAFKESFGDTHLVLTRSQNLQTVFRLAESWDGYLSCLDSKRRSAFKRHYRLAQKAAGGDGDSITTERADGENLPEMLGEFMRMHQSHWQKLRRLGHFGDWPRSEQFHRELAEAGLQQQRLRLVRIAAGQQLLGYKYGYIFGNTYVDFLDARVEPQGPGGIGPGRIMYGEMIKQAIQEKAVYIDSMQGIYKHKLEMGGELVDVQNLWVICRQPVRRLRVRLFRWLAYLWNLVYFRVWYQKVACRLPLRRKGLRSSWIRSCGLA